MSKRCGSWIAWVTFAVAVGMAAPSHAITGSVRVTVGKAGFIVDAGGGKGILTFRHRKITGATAYPVARDLTLVK